VTEIIYKQESYRIVGACFEVYNDKGCGFLEPVYQECLGIEFTSGFRQQFRGTIQNSNMNALQRLSTSNQKRTFAIFLFDVFASIRVIRGLIQ
jgi:hypothetical protein